jgi:hypothetical protein
MHLWDLVHRDPLPHDVSLANTEAVDVTAVLKFYAESENDHVVVPRDLPNIAPPFESVFMFGHWPNVFRASGQIRHGNHKRQAGCLLTSKKQSDGWRTTLRFCGGIQQAEWATFTAIIDVQQSGHLKHRDNGGDFIVMDPTPFAKTFARQVHAGDLQAAANELASVFQPFLLATALMHCKNVTATRVSVPPKLLKAREKRGRATYSYSVLNITPMRAALTHEGGLGRGNTLNAALHICRGHFKDYRDGSGLFGKHRAIYWWDQALRGSVENGVHVKDYRITEARA